MIKDALAEGRGKQLSVSTASKIQIFERKLETAKLSQAEIIEIQKQLKML